MRRKILLAAIAATLVGCANADDGEPIEWSALGLVGKTLTLIDEKAVQVFRISEGGIAVTTIGIKDQALAGPILYWKIHGNVLYESGNVILTGASPRAAMCGG